MPLEASITKISLFQRNRRNIMESIFDWNRLLFFWFEFYRMNIEHEKKRVSINTSKKGVFLEEQFLDMANSAPVLLWVSNADNLRIFFNKAWLQFTGCTPEEEYGIG